MEEFSENIVEKGENADNQHFLLFPKCVLPYNLEDLADDKINVTSKLKYVFERVENILEKEKMLITCIFSFSHNIFIESPLTGSLKAGTVCSKC